MNKKSPSASSSKLYHYQLHHSHQHYHHHHHHQQVVAGILNSCRRHIGQHHLRRCHYHHRHPEHHHRHYLLRHYHHTHPLHWLLVPFVRQFVSCCALIRGHVFALGFCDLQPRALSPLCFETRGNRKSRAIGLLHRQMMPVICRRHHRRAWRLQELLVGWDHWPAVLLRLLHRQMEAQM